MCPCPSENKLKCEATCPVRGGHTHYPHSQEAHINLLYCESRQEEIAFSYFIQVALCSITIFRWHNWSCIAWSVCVCRLNVNRKKKNLGMIRICYAEHNLWIISWSRTSVTKHNLVFNLQMVKGIVEGCVQWKGKNKNTCILKVSADALFITFISRHLCHFTWWMKSMFTQITLGGSVRSVQIF